MLFTVEQKVQQAVKIFHIWSIWTFGEGAQPENSARRRVYVYVYVLVCTRVFTHEAF